MRFHRSNGQDKQQTSTPLPPVSHIPPCVSFHPQVVSFYESAANVYDTNRTMRIDGKGFDLVDSSILKLSFNPKLLVDEDYTFDVLSSNHLVLTLQPQKK